MKELKEFISEQMVFELSSKFLKNAAKAAIDKGDLRQVKIFLNGAKKAEKEENKILEKQFISIGDFFNICDTLKKIFIKYGNKMFKSGWQNHVKAWVRDSGGNSYEGTDWRSSATYGMTGSTYKELKKPNVDFDKLFNEFSDEVNKVVKDFYKDHPDAKNNFIRKYKTNEEARKQEETWEVDGDRDKYYVALGLPENPHPYSFGSKIFGIVSCVTEGDTHHTDSGYGGGLGMPAVVIIAGQSYAPAYIIEDFK